MRLRKKMSHDLDIRGFIGVVAYVILFAVALYMAKKDGYV